MAKHPTELLKGTLDLLILRTLALQPLHGVGIADRIRQITGGTFDVGPGSLFPAVHRLEQEGFIVGHPRRGAVVGPLVLTPPAEIMCSWPPWPISKTMNPQTRPRLSRSRESSTTERR